jgi:hypothetical protein
LSFRAINSLIIGAAVILGAIIVAAVLIGPLNDDNDNDTQVADTTVSTGASDASDDALVEETDDADSAETDTAPAEEPTPEAEPTPEPEMQQTVAGVVTDAGSDEPLSGVTVVAERDGVSEATATTGEDGRFELADVPPDATLSFSLEGYRTVEQPVDDDTELTVALQSSQLAGRVLDQDGQPIWDATVASGDALTWTEEDGTFQLGDAPDEGEVIFKAPGFAAQRVPIGELGNEVTMQPKSVKGIYATAGATADDERFNGLMDMIDRTELNAIVLDVKDSAGLVFYNTEVEMAHEIGSVAPTYDVERRVAQLNERGIYAIARVVIFEDPILAEARPDLAIQDSQEGGLWRTFGGLPWVNPYSEEVWNYNIALMEEAVRLGFDEIQLDYMRFPSDGPLNRADYGQESNEETRDQAIGNFLQASYEVIAPTPAYLTGDIFGMTLWDPTEGGIGQSLVTVTEHLDYVLPMIYPSHFYEGSMGFDVPNDHPYEVIYRSLNNGASMLPERLRPKIRPWLQDFSHGPGISYGDHEVREQIRATEDFGASGWILWNAASSYHEGALGPADS